MQLVFVLSFLALCIAVRGQEEKCIAPAEFREDAAWLTSKSDTIPPQGYTYPSQEIAASLKADANQKLLSESPVDQGELDVKIPWPFTCPYHHHYIWKIKNCWVVKAISVFPFIAKRPLRYAHCQTQTCKLFPGFTGRCRRSCFRTYSPVILACKGKFGFYLTWFQSVTLPQCCRCSKC